MTATELIEALGGRNGTAKCPCHDDREPSFSASDGEGGKLLVHCHAGCSQADLIEKLRSMGLWEQRSDGLTVAELAAAKKLPEQLLRDSGFTDDQQNGRAVVRMDYMGAGGEIISRRYRGSLEKGKARFWCRKGDKQQLFGLWRLRRDEAVIVVEGETDALTLWHHGHNAIGVPGAEAWREREFVEQIASCPVFLVHVEPDDGGKRFRRSFLQSKLKDYALFFSIDGAKDPSELHLQDPARFEERFRAALDTAASAEDEPAPESTGSNGLLITAASDLILQPINWLWRGYLACGKFHMLAGAPGTGKTTIALAMGAILTRSSGRWPDGTSSPRRQTLIWTGEDDPADTLAPRLVAMGADLRRIHFVGNVVFGDERRPFDPAQDMALLVARARAISDLGLLIVDPVITTVQGDSHKNAETRRGLAPLVDFAAQSGAAVLGISHFSKGSSGRDPLERVTGSIAFGALARIVLATAKRGTEEEEERIFVRVKSNIGPDGGGFAYSLDYVDLGDGLAGSRVVWGHAIDGSARELLEEVERSDEDAEEASSLDEAKAFLAHMLEYGRHPAAGVMKEAASAGLSSATIRRAKISLGIKVKKEGSAWYWQMPTPELGPRDETRGPTSGPTRDPNSSDLNPMPRADHAPELGPRGLGPRDQEAHPKNVSILSTFPPGEPNSLIGQEVQGAQPTQDDQGAHDFEVSTFDRGPNFADLNPAKGAA